MTNSAWRLGWGASGLVWLVGCASGGDLAEPDMVPSEGGAAGSSATAGHGGTEPSGGTGAQGGSSAGRGGTGAQGGAGGAGAGGAGAAAGTSGIGGVGGASAGGTGGAGAGGTGGAGAGGTGGAGTGGASTGGTGGAGAGGTGGAGAGGTGGGGSCDPTTPLNTCATATYLTDHCGDASCGFLCGPAGGIVVAQHQGTGSAWFRLTAVECSTCPADILGELLLSVPAGMNYDLHLWANCGTLLASSTGGTGQDEDIFTTITTDLAAWSDTTDYYVEVRYAGGSSCAEWSLQVVGSDC